MTNVTSRRERREPIVRLPSVDGSRGAPMGRSVYPWDHKANGGHGGMAITTDADKACYKKPARIGALEMSEDAAYDSGGAYWGIGETIYVATNGDNAGCFLMTTRAASLDAARAEFESRVPGLITWAPTSQNIRRHKERFPWLPVKGDRRPRSRNTSSRKSTSPSPT